MTVSSVFFDNVLGTRPDEKKHDTSKKVNNPYGNKKKESISTKEY